MGYGGIFLEKSLFGIQKIFSTILKLALLSSTNFTSDPSNRLLLNRARFTARLQHCNTAEPQLAQSSFSQFFNHPRAGS